MSHPVVLVDLAVPRDIDPEAGKLENITLYDIDYFKVDIKSEKVRANIARADHILEEQMEEFYTWYECRDVIPKIQEIKEEAARDVELRLTKVIRDLPLEKEMQEKLRGCIGAAAGKVVNKMLFGLRDTVSQAAFRECVEGLEKLYEE